MFSPNVNIALIETRQELERRSFRVPLTNRHCPIVSGLSNRKSLVGVIDPRARRYKVFPVNQNDTRNTHISSTIITDGVTV